MAFGEQERVAHLLRRFGLGASQAEVDFYGQGGYEAAVDRLLNDEAIEEHFALDIADLKNGRNDRVNIGAVVLWWSSRLLMTRHPLREKMTVFWHNHFATSASKVQGPLLMLQQNETLRKNALGSFKTLLLEVSKDPAMILWLDNQQNTKGHANENYAREVMELFTLGIGHYTEKDVQEAARAFTGWSILRVRNDDLNGAGAEFQLRSYAHDGGTKTVLGRTGNLGGEDVLDLLTSNKQCAKFLTHKMWEWFVYEKPDQHVVDHFADILYQSDYDIKKLLREIMLSREFSSTKSVRKLIKNPVDFVIPPLRQIGVGEAIATATTGPIRRRLAPAAQADQSMKAMGMSLLYPRDVSGWKPGETWISSATMVARMKWAERIPVAPLQGKTALEIADILDAPISKDKLKLLAGQKPQDLARQTIRLIFASPEYQFC